MRKLVILQWVRWILIWIIGLTLDLIGLAGIPGDVKIWEGWLAMEAIITAINGSWMIRASLFVIGTAIITYPQWLPRIHSLWVKQDSVFDVPIKEALWLLWENVDHTFRSSGVSDRYFFNLLHKKMCSGDLPVVGRLGRGGDIQILSPDQCERLNPREINVPINPTALQGVSFVLSPSETGIPPSKMFWGLRVRSKDLHQIWPETKARNGPVTQGSCTKTNMREDGEKA